MPQDVGSPHSLGNNSKAAVLTEVCRCDIFVKILKKKIILIVPSFTTHMSGNVITRRKVPMMYFAHLSKNRL